MINKLRHFSTRSENVYFGNNGQALIPVLTVVFTHAKHNLIKLQFYDN